MNKLKSLGTATSILPSGAGHPGHQGRLLLLETTLWNEFSHWPNAVGLKELPHSSELFGKALGLGLLLSLEGATRMCEWK